MTKRKHGMLNVLRVYQLLKDYVVLITVECSQGLPASEGLCGVDNC